MPKVKQKHKNESFEAMFRRFKRIVDNAETLKDLRKHEYYEKPSSKRKRARAAAKKRWQKKVEHGARPAKLY